MIFSNINMLRLGSCVVAVSLLAGCGAAKLTAEQIAVCEDLKAEQANDRAAFLKKPANETYMRATMDSIAKALDTAIKTRDTASLSQKLDAAYLEGIEVCAKNNERAVCKTAHDETKALMARRRERQNRFGMSNCPGKLEENSLL